MSDEHTPQALDPPEAFELLRHNPAALLIDVRSTMEFLMVGHPRDAVHIPWLDEPDWVAEPQKFVRRVREALLGGVSCDEAGCVPVVLICRSGRRSADAGRALLEAGLQDIYTVKGGFEGPLDESHHRSTMAGWRYHGLPWEQC